LGPRHTPENFRGFWCGPEGWGSMFQARQGQAQLNELIVCEGRFVIAEITLRTAAAPKFVRVEQGGQRVDAAFRGVADGVVVSFRQPLTIQSGQTLTIQLT
jgi:hypothetical protein